MTVAPLAALATALCVVCVGGLVRAEVRHDRRGRFRWKPLASLAFCAVPLLAGALGGDDARRTAAAWVLAGLVLGAIGDVLLMYEDQRAFLGGLVSFLCGHVAYVIAFAALVAPAHWIEGDLRWFLPVPVVAGAVVLRWLWPHLGTLRGPVIGYVLVISAMLIGGVAVAVQGTTLPPLMRALAIAGATAFYASDLTVARDRFVTRDVWNKVIGLPLYYGAQLLIAWSVLP